MIDDKLEALFQAAHTDPKAVLPLLQRLEGDWDTEYTSEIEGMLIAIVPQMVAILTRDAVNSSLYEDRYICDALARLGRKAALAVPTLIEHAELYPRLECNVLAMGRIGGPGVIRKLIEWTYWSGNNHDRKRSNAACTAIRMMGEDAIMELLALACSEFEDSHNRSRAILNLYDCTSFSHEMLIPIIVREIERPDCYLQCIQALSDTLVRIGQKLPSVVILHIESSFFCNWQNFQRYLDILSKMGNTAVPTLVRALEHPGRKVGAYEIVAALGKTGSDGSEYLFKTISDASSDSRNRLHAIFAIPAAGRPFLEILVKAIHRAGNSDCIFVEQAVTRLGDFTDEFDRADSYLRTLLGRPEVEIVNAANRSRERIALRRRHG